MKLIQGDCIEEMKKMPDNSVDAIVTDPPYDLTSMNTPRPDKQGKEGLQFCRIQASKGFMGIEKEPEYIKIAKARLKYYLEQRKL